MIEGTTSANVRFLVGPTGSGKTTTIAKLCAEEVLAGGPRPLVVNGDTMRLGAGEQLASLARLLNVEVVHVSAPSDLRARVASAPPGQSIYVDTAGLSSDRSIERSVRELVDSVGAAASVTAVVSATAARSSLQRGWTQIEGLRPESCAITHMDESDEPGTACSWLEEVGLPLRWLGTGQRIPEDLSNASGSNLALWLAA